MHELFEVDIRTLNDLQLADWIKKCRLAIKPSDKPNYRENTNFFYTDIAEFCNEWEQHFEIYKDIYQSEKYQTAILANGIIPDVFTLLTPDGDYDISQIMYDLTCYLDDNYRCIQTEIEDYSYARRTDIEHYREIVQKKLNSPNHRAAIKELLINRKQHNISNFTLLKNEHSIATHDIKEILKNVKTLKKESYPVHFSTAKRQPHEKGKFLDPDEKIQVYYMKDVLEDLKSYEITKQVYFDYVNSESKDFDRKLFGAICFYLSLNLNLAETLYNMNGYTIQKSREQRDIILTKCFQLGFPLVYANALLAKANISTLNSRIFPTKNPHVTIMDFTSEALPEKKYIYQLRFAVNHIVKFLSDKEKIQRGHEQKIENCQTKIIEFMKAQDDIETNINLIQKEIDYLRTHLEGNKGKLKKAETELRKSQRTLGGLQRQIETRKESIELHQKAISELYRANFPSLEYLGYLNKDYDNLDLTNIESLKNELIELQLEYDKPENLTH